MRSNVQGGTGECLPSRHMKMAFACPALDPGQPQPVLQVYGIASEDMDSLTFATPKLIRNLMKPQTQNVPINEYDYDKVPIG